MIMWIPAHTMKTWGHKWGVVWCGAYPMGAQPRTTAKGISPLCCPRMLPPGQRYANNVRQYQYV